MGPVKFDDIPKVAADCLGDDYQCSGYQFKAKQKTNWDGAVITTAVDLFGKDCATPAKLTWKFPQPLGLKAFAVDKLEMDKAGKFKFEASGVFPDFKDVKLDFKSDLVDISKATFGCTYSGIKNAQLKLDTKMDADIACEATYTVCSPATIGMKFTSKNITAPDLGLRLQQGPGFAALLVKDKFSTFSGFCHYKVNDQLMAVGKYEQTSKGSNCSAGVEFQVQKGTKVKAKLDKDLTLSAGCKHEVSSGFTVLAGCKYGSGNLSYGLALNIE
eukprot:gnl/TRDRNA2_/TRDRNA2_178420_c0_seq1.p1 gnl/TRDRNA2_/TRDRNA2_178420_c0~~gnl/TRDRNA2_/TRDRNA2_178420_c0_seq1.p1  ORF type:complete len:296 (+),score=80.79 gnl/TRDRNA2_/TRDRNA2_178420_c0_seq1:74-889(+)